MKSRYLMIFVAIAAPILNFLVYDKLPDQIPVHWGIDGEIDRYGDKSWSFVFASLPLLMYLLMRVIPKIDPRRDSYEKHAKAYESIILALVLFMAGLHGITLLASLGYDVEIDFLLKGVMGILFLVMGNYMPQIRHNYTLGIRTPWTLASETVWYKTHRIAGYGFFILGIVWLLFAMWDHPFVFYLLMGTLILLVVGLFAWSWRLYDLEQKKKQ